MGDLRQDDLTSIADVVREAYLTPPDEATEARHLAAMAVEARVIPHEAIPARPRARGLKEELVTRLRMAAPAAKLAGLTVIAALTTGGLATAGAIDLPALPLSASDRAEAVHDAIEGADPPETPPGTLIGPAAGQGAGASDEEHGKSESASKKNADARQNGADPVEGAGRAFGDSVSDRASGDREATETGAGFGQSVSGEAKELVDHPEPGSQETGETNSQGGQETGETHSQQGQETAASHGGGKPQD